MRGKAELIRYVMRSVKKVKARFSLAFTFLVTYVGIIGLLFLVLTRYRLRCQDLMTRS